MQLTWKDLTIEFGHIVNNKLTENWTWLFGNEMTPVLISSIGDMFLSDQNGRIHWLDVGGGTIKNVADNVDDLKEKMKNNEIANEWFMFDLVSDIKESGLELTEGKLFGYKKLPVIGGEYSADNFELTDVEVHFALSGQIHQQIKDLPDGTKVNLDLV